ncbi:isopentenyl phosphate kinase [Natronoarchaeum philippinense]|uniref:Isopentenyl phosphate kinase n=1 Tax=Natronoarchaeum philippinense TaxID=558529 RepID=A0A285N554_NATPI|nr:isopentenyl phosphate kinase [Natronoarchaeum philippinense]SNZ04604.1 isopentenyl phosphate kinase [Natronoarchaeum philippinense]
MTTVLKLGGSVVTEKDRDETVDGPALDRAADAVAAARNGAVDDLVIVHGGGSFGHPNAAEWGVTTDDGTHDPDGVLAIHGAMTTLNKFVLRRLRDAGVPAVPVHPFSAAHRDADADLTLPAGQIETLLGEGFVPVCHGDVVGHVGEGVTVLSGDEIVVDLATQLDADRIGVCSTVPGVLDADDAVIPEIETFDDVADVLGGSDATDVSGGMAGKVRELLALDAPASIFDLDALADFLAGERPGTTVERAD